MAIGAAAAARRRSVQQVELGNARTDQYFVGQLDRVVKRHLPAPALLLPSAEHAAASAAATTVTAATATAALTRFGGGALSFGRSEEHTSELQSLMRISYAVFCLKTKNKNNTTHNYVYTLLKIHHTTNI